MEKQTEIQSSIESVSMKKIPVDELEAIPNYLINMKHDIEKLQLEKEQLRNITYSNYISGRWKE